MCKGLKVGDKDETDDRRSEYKSQRMIVKSLTR